MINPNKAGLVSASLIGGVHLIWLHLVLAHAAQAVLDFIFWAHMIRPNFTVTAFDPVAAVTLLVFTSGSGYVFGYLGGVIWNKLHPQEAFAGANGESAFRARNAELLAKKGQPNHRTRPFYNHEKRQNSTGRCRWRLRGAGLLGGGPRRARGPLG